MRQNVQTQIIALCLISLLIQFTETAFIAYITRAKEELACFFFGFLELELSHEKQRREIHLEQTAL